MSDWFGGLIGDISNSLSTVTSDLQEFVDTVQGDTSETVNETVSALHDQNTSKEGITLTGLAGAVEGIVGTIKDGLREDGSVTDRRVLRPKEGEELSYDRSDAQLKTMQRSRQTYLVEPANKEAFTEWASSFDIHTKTEEITGLLSSDDAMRKLHNELVPHKVPYDTFWHRYYFSLHELKEAGQRRDALLKKMGQMEEEEQGGDLDFGDWEDEGEEEERDDRSSTKEQTEEPPQKEDGGTENDVTQKEEVSEVKSTEPLHTESTEETAKHEASDTPQLESTQQAKQNEQRPPKSNKQEPTTTAPDSVVSPTQSGNSSESEGSVVVIQKSDVEDEGQDTIKANDNGDGDGEDWEEWE